MWSKLLNLEFLNNRVSDYLLAVAIFLAGIILIQVVKRIVFGRAGQWVKKTPSTFDDFLLKALRRRLLPLSYFAALYLGFSVLSLDSLGGKILKTAGGIILAFSSVSFLLDIAGYSLESYFLKKEDQTRRNILNLFLVVIKVIAWGIALLVLLDNFGVKISGLLAGLGIGGVAVAFAAQAILADLFSYFTIFFDRPFEIGDYIVVGEYMGAVEYIGMKTTRLRSLGGEEIIFSNTDLTNSRVRNYKRMKERRISFRIGVTYDTPPAQLKEIPELIAGIIKGIAGARFDRAHFIAYGDYSLLFEVVYYVLSKDYRQYADIQQEINLALKEEFTRRGIAFALPARRLLVEKGESI
jgi:small-conductance mechanosensitive channel